MNKAALSFIRHLIFVTILIHCNSAIAKKFCNICGQEIVENHSHNECDRFRRTLREKIPQLSEKGCIYLVRKLLHKMAILGFITDRKVIICCNAEISDKVGGAAEKLWHLINQWIHSDTGANTVLQYFRNRLNQKEPIINEFNLRSITIEETINVTEELRHKVEAGRNDLEDALRFFILCREMVLSGFPAIEPSKERILYQVEDGTRNSKKIIGAAEKIFNDEITKLSKWGLRELIPVLPMRNIDEFSQFFDIFNMDNPYAKMELISDNGIIFSLKFVFNAAKFIEFDKARKNLAKAQKK